MTRKEFEERTGITNFTDDYYENIIEEGYYRSDMDKDAYCKAVAPLVNNPLMKEWVCRMKTASACFNTYRREQQEDAELMLDVADCLRRTGDEISANTLEERAAERLGRKEMIVYKAAKSLELTADDLEYIKDNRN